MARPHPTGHSGSKGCTGSPRGPLLAPAAPARPGQLRLQAGQVESVRHNPGLLLLVVDQVPFRRARPLRTPDVADLQPARLDQPRFAIRDGAEMRRHEAPGTGVLRLLLDP